MMIYVIYGCLFSWQIFLLFHVFFFDIFIYFFTCENLIAPTLFSCFFIFFTLTFLFNLIRILRLKFFWLKLLELIAEILNLKKMKSLIGFDIFQLLSNKFGNQQLSFFFYIYNQTFPNLYNWTSSRWLIRFYH